MGPFPSSFGNMYILLAMDYLSKWVEAIACPKNDAITVVGFIQRNILSIFGAPKIIISDEGSHFANNFFTKIMSIYGIKHLMGLAYHPQSNAQAEISNREKKKILEKTVNASRKDRSIKLDDALCAYRTAYKTPIGMSPYLIVYGKPCHLPLEMEYKAMWVIKKLNCDFQDAKEKRLLQMNELEELKNEAYDNDKIYKENSKMWHDKKILRREFKAGEQVLLYTVVVSTPFGAVTLKTKSRGEFKVNDQRLKHYLRGSMKKANQNLEKREGNY